MKVRAVTLFAVLVASIGVSHASPTCASGEICGTTVISGTGPGVVVATLSTTATIALGANGAPNAGPGGAVEIEHGDGPFVGFAIAADQPDRKGLGLVFVRIAEDARAGQDPYLWSGFGSALSVRPPSLTLTPGTYRLYLITAPDSSATITLRFDGLDGTSALEPTAPTRFASLRLGARVVEADGVPVHSIGASGTLAGTGIAIGVFPLEASFHAVTAQTYCFSEFLFGEPVPDEIVYLPGCPAVADHAAVAAVSSPGPYFQRADVLAGVLPPGRYGFGYTYAGAALMDARVPSYEAWLALD